MDNKLFNVNGEGFFKFKLTLELLLTDREGDNTFDVNSKFGIIGTRVVGYKYDKHKGLILYWHIDKNSEKKGIRPIDELITTPETKEQEKSLRKYKLALLNSDIKGRVGIPLDILTQSLWNWLINFDKWNELEFDNWEENVDHDGSNSKGFRIYTEDWGRINGVNSYISEDYSIGAIKPAYCWYGK